MNKQEEKALRLRIRAEEIAKAQKEKDAALKKKIRLQERENAREGGPVLRFTKSAIKKGFKEIKKAV